MAERMLIRGARLVDPASDRDETVDVLVTDGIVTGVGAELDSSEAEVLDASGLILAPGLVDMHTHLREPGGEDRETVETGTRAAAAGGYTAVCAMANTTPVADDSAVIQEVRALAEEAGFCDVLPVGAITMGLEGERLTEMGEMAALGVRMFSDDGHCVPGSRLMRMAMEYSRAFDVILAQHAQDEALTEGWQMHEGPTASMLGLSGAPSEAEEIIVSRDLLLARLTGARIHFCHLSSKGSVEMVRGARSRGLRVTAEVTPHHLTFTDEELVGYDTNFKVNPPLRSAEDAAAALEALVDGTADAVATDHAPHAQVDKEAEFGLAANGISGLETALGVLLAAVGARRLTLARAIEALTTGPAGVLAGRSGRRDGSRGLTEGAPADIVVFDAGAIWTVTVEALASRGKNTPLLARELPGRVLLTVAGGRLAYRDAEA